MTGISCHDRHSNFVIGVAICLREVVRYHGVPIVRDSVLVSGHSITQGIAGLSNEHGRAGGASDGINKHADVQV